MAFEIFQSEKTSKFHFRLKAKNGQVILTSQAYAQKSGAENGIQSVIKNTSDGDKQFDRLESKNGSPYFVLKSPNGQVIGQSEMYSSASAMNKGIESVCKNAQEGKIKDLTQG
jgi:hypothetical protein